MACVRVFGSVLLSIVVVAAVGLDNRADEPVSDLLSVSNADACHPEGMRPYAERIEYTDVTIELVPIPAGEFLMGSPDSEDGRNPDEDPQHKVRIDPFWMGKYEITWDAFDVWMYRLDEASRRERKLQASSRHRAALLVSLPSIIPYGDPTFGMGRKKHPAICMTHLAARMFCKWLSAKTGRYYRLPTEAEWEYACRAGTSTAYSFGDDPRKLGRYAWYFDNADEKYHRVGMKDPNRWGLYDMHGNVAEWVLDQYDAKSYERFAGRTADNPLVVPTRRYPCVVRGGSWNDDPAVLRSAARFKSTPEWSAQDPQHPKSLAFHTDADFVGFRIVRPYRRPSDKEQQNKWDKNLLEVQAPNPQP